MTTAVATMGGSMPPKSDIDTSTFSGRVAARLRELREAKGWTVAELQERINNRLAKERRVAQSTVHGWDNGSRKIDPDLYPLLASIFQKSVRTFIPAS